MDRSAPTSDLDAFRSLYRQHHSFVWAVLRRFGVEGAATDDAVQETFIVAYRRLSNFSGGSARPWLYGIARRVASNHRRTSQRGARRVRACREKSQRSIETPMLETLVEIERWITTLSQSEQDLFYLSEVDGLTGPELAQALQLKLNTVYWRLRQLRTKLVTELGDEGSLRKLREERPSASASGWAALVPALRAEQGLTKAAAIGAVSASRRTAMPAVSAWFGGIGLAGVVGVTAAWITPVAHAPQPAAATTTVAERHDAAEPVRPPFNVLHDDASAVSRAAQHEQPSPVSARRPKRRSKRTTDPRPVAVQTSSSPSPAPTNTAQWNARLRQALNDLDSGHPERTLRWTQTPAVRPATPLDDLRIALHIEALCSLNRREQAMREAASFAIDRPLSAVRARIERTCAGTTESSAAGQEFE